MAGLFDLLAESLVAIASDPDDSSTARVRSKLSTVPDWQQKVMNTVSRYIAACLLLPLDGTVEVEVEAGILTSAFRLMSCMVGEGEWRAQSSKVMI